jgi:uncharacterized protein (DUF58 family)
MHNSDGRVAILWRLGARHSVATCVLEPLPVGALLTLRQDDQVLFQEVFPDAQLAEARAAALRARLKAKGWRVISIEAAEPGRRRA